MRRLATAGLATGLVVLTSGCGLFDSSPSPFKAADPAPVALALKVTAPVRVGLIVSTNSPEGEGRDLAPRAAGARVAEVRFNQHGTKVVLDVQDDHGTVQGARTAVKALAASGVVGIVYASEGSHLAAGLTAAAAAHLPVLLPYPDSLPGTPGVWATGPTSAQVRQVLNGRLAAERLGRPFEVSLGTGAQRATSLVALGSSTAAPSADALTAADVPATTKVVQAWGPATASAALVERLQVLHLSLPVALGPSALSTVFSDKLALDARTTGASSSAGRFLTAGLPTGNDAADRAGFAAAVRLAASDPSVTSVSSSKTFGQQGADSADGESHDAVVALVRAASLSRTADAAGVEAALPSLLLSARDGLVGPSLSFARATAVQDKDVLPLQAAVRADGSHLVWFALPPVAATR